MIGKDAQFFYTAERRDQPSELQDVLLIVVNTRDKGKTHNYLHPDLRESCQVIQDKPVGHGRELPMLYVVDYFEII